MTEFPRKLTGFSDLVSSVNKNYPSGRPSIPSKAEELFKDLCHEGFLGPLLEVESSYVADLLESKGLLDISSVRSHEWVRRVESLMKSELTSVTGRRQQALNYFLREDQFEKTASSIFSASEYFIREKVNGSWLRRRTATESDTKNLLAELGYVNSPNHIPYYGATKIVLWLHRYGLANYLAPPTRQVSQFISDITGRSLDHYDADTPGEWWGIYVARYLASLKKIASELSHGARHISVRDVALSAWIFYTTRNVIKLCKSRRRLTPSALLEHLEVEGIALTDFIDKLSDIDEMDKIPTKLCPFLAHLSS